MNERNCHFVSRFLTKPWEFGQRQLYYYDFDNEQIQTNSSKSLFAEVGTNTAEIEQRLNELIETPISNAITKLVPSEAIDIVEIDEWPLFRALNLLLLLQWSRASDKEPYRSRVREALSWDDTTLDQLVNVCQQRYMVFGLRGHPRAPLCYPSHGLFPLPIRHQSGSYSAIYAIPLTENYAVARVPRDVNMDDVFQTITCQGGYLTSSSVGTTASRVIIHPSVIEAFDGTTVAGKIEEFRNGARKMFALCSEIKKIDQEMDEISEELLGTSRPTESDLDPRSPKQ